MCLLFRPSGQYINVKPLMAAQNNLHKFPCLLNLPPTKLEWSFSFYGLAVPSVYGNQFMDQQVDLTEVHSPKILPVKMSECKFFASFYF